MKSSLSGATENRVVPLSGRLPEVLFIIDCVVKGHFCDFERPLCVVPDPITVQGHATFL